VSRRFQWQLARGRGTGGTKKTQGQEVGLRETIKKCIKINAAKNSERKRDRGSDFLMKLGRPLRCQQDFMSWGRFNKGTGDRASPNGKTPLRGSQQSCYESPGISKEHFTTGCPSSSNGAASTGAQGEYTSKGGEPKENHSSSCYPKPNLQQRQDLRGPSKRKRVCSRQRSYLIKLPLKKPEKEGRKWAQKVFGHFPVRSEKPLTIRLTAGTSVSKELSIAEDRDGGGEEQHGRKRRKLKQKFAKRTRQIRQMTLQRRKEKSSTKPMREIAENGIQTSYKLKHREKVTPAGDRSQCSAEMKKQERVMEWD